LTDIKRREFLKLLAASSVASSVAAKGSIVSSDLSRPYSPSRILNEYIAYLPGEKETLSRVPKVVSLQNPTATIVVEGKHSTIRINETLAGWRLVAIAAIDGTSTAVFEKHVSHRGVIVYVTAAGTLAAIPKWIGDLANIRPRVVAAPAEVQLRRTAGHRPGPDLPGDYILNSNEDPCYENVAALGKEYIGWTLVGNEQSGPLHSLYLQADGVSRELKNDTGQAAWGQDELGPAFDPREFFPSYNSQAWQYEKGYSKRTLLGGYLPVADIGVWNREYKCGYEAMVLLPEGVEAKYVGRLRTMIAEADQKPTIDYYRDGDNSAFVDTYVDGDAASFFLELLQIWRKWNAFFEQSMPVEIPDEWLLAGARAGIMLCRCSYRGLEPTYQIGEGAYTMIPERSHALFPVAHYEFIWAHQLWNLTGSSDGYFQYYLDKYVLQDGNLVYNTQDQVEAPFCVGMMLSNSARSYLYEGDIDHFRKRFVILDRMAKYVIARYEYSKAKYSRDDPHFGLIWGSPEADWGNVKKDTPSDHPFFYQNATGVWRGLQDIGKALEKAAKTDPELAGEGARYLAIAEEMRDNIVRSLKTTLSRRNEAMRAADITPFTPEDISRMPTQLESYENHRFMQDWFLADWGDESLDRGHLNHRRLAGMQLVGLHTDDDEMRTSNFMEHGTLAVRIRQKDYRPFLLTLYGLMCFAADSGNRYSPEDAVLPDGSPGEAGKYSWSAVVNSALQPAMGLRWLLCYEESNQPVCHLQKAAPSHWFKPGEHISVQHCPTRFGRLSWWTGALDLNRYRCTLESETRFSGELHIHFHPPDGQPVRQSSVGKVQDGVVIVDPSAWLEGRRLTIDVQ